MLPDVTKSVQTRWLKIIDELMDPESNFANRDEFAKKVGTNRQTLWRDMSNPEFTALLNRHLEIRIKNDVVAKALSNIFNKIMDGDVPVSKWFLEYRIRLEEVSKKSAPETDIIDGEFTEISKTALIQSNGQTEELLDALNKVDRLVGDE